MSGEDFRRAIVIFGAPGRPGGRASRAMRQRVNSAHAIGRKLKHPVYIPTGAGRTEPSEAEVMRRLLLRRGIADENIMLEETAKDTLASVRAVRRLLRLQGIGGTVYAATSGFHLPRCLLLLRLAGLKTRPCPAPRGRATSKPWKQWLWRAREVAALPYDAALLLWLRLLRRL
jgi:uncharacterized SAM-binding protein YcdF (DUF218 family)